MLHVFIGFSLLSIQLLPQVCIKLHLALQNVCTRFREITIKSFKITISAPKRHWTTKQKSNKQKQKQHTYMQLL